jgi:hypothetical protein
MGLAKEKYTLFEKNKPETFWIKNALKMFDSYEYYERA